MRIDRLRLTNFRQHESTELEFGPGLTGIVGPNGAGKTTILEAIAWSLYGMPAARGSRDTIRRRGAPPRSKVEVEMEFALGPHRYRVLRSLANAELYQDGDPAPVANSIGAVTERVTRLLGMTRDEFFNTYFTGQKELAVMAAMSAPERAQFLSRVLGYDKIRVALERLKEKRSALRARLEGLRSGLADPAELDAAEARAKERIAAARDGEARALAALAEAERQLAEVQPRWETIQRLRESAGQLERELQVAGVQQRGVRERVETLRRETDEAARAVADLRGLREQLAPRGTLLAERAELDRLAEAAASRRNQSVQFEAVRAQLAALDEQIAGLPPASAVEEARARVAALRAELAAATIDAGDRRAAWVRDAQDAQTKRQHLLDQYQELKDQRQAILDAGPDGHCPTCARPLGGEFENVVGVLDRQLEDIVSNGNYFKRRIEQLKDEPADLVEAERQQLALTSAESEAVATLARLEAGQRDAARVTAQHERLTQSLAELRSALGAEVASYDQARHAEVRRRVAELEPLQLRAERVAVLAERAAALEAELAARTAEATELGAAVERLERARADLGYTEASFRETQQQIGRTEAARQAAELALVRARADSSAAAEAGAAVERRRVERAAREREVATASGELALHQELDRALTDLRTDLNATLRPDLSALASGFLRDLTNGRYTDLELDEDYVSTLLDDGDPKAVISGGEEDVTNLALRLAISQMIAERAGQPLSLLVLDEIFGSLDEERRAAVVELLRSLADRFPQVILITHIDSVRDGFDRVIRVGLDLSRGVATAWDEPLGGHDVAA
jgi:exonuclease SbcC